VHASTRRRPLITNRWAAELIKPMNHKIIKPMRHIVHLVVDSNLREPFEKWSKTDHVWIVESEQNTKLAKQIWSAASHGVNEWAGITTFQNQNEPLALAIDYLGTIDEHHCKWSYDIPWHEIRVYLPAGKVLQEKVVQPQFEEKVKLKRITDGLYSIQKAAQPDNQADGKRRCGSQKAKSKLR
jgi:hypothetical protein